MSPDFRSPAIAAALIAVMAGAASPLFAQSSQSAKPSSGPSAGNAPKTGNVPPTVPAGVAPPPGYVIGPDDVLSIVYWRDKDMTTDVKVRPDGRISLALINEVDAAGLTPDQLRDKLTEESKKYFEDPSITVVVKEINSRMVFIQGTVAKQGPYALTAPTTVAQMLARAGGLGEFAKSKDIVIIRTENGKQRSFKFNYKEVMAGKKLQQNIELKPGDTIIVP